MDTRKQMTRGEFLKLVFGFALAVVVAKATTFIPRESRKSDLAYGTSTYGGRTA